MNIFEMSEERAAKNKLKKKVQNILDLESQYKEMSDDQLKQKSTSLMERRRNGESENELLIEAFALVREATWRTLGMRQYPTQIMGGVSIAEGNLAEMATGEGKTIVVPLVAYLHALSGENVHIVTSNEYLATRDSEQMSKLFDFLGMDVGLSLSGMSQKQKQDAYSCNITYTTASELGFDYLRDNGASSSDQKVLNGLNNIVIDEADHALIDDASTPLIIGKNEALSNREKEWLRIAAKAIPTLTSNDYEMSEDKRCATLTDEGIRKLEAFFGIEDMFDEEFSPLFKICNNALKAHLFFENGVHYVVKNGKIEIVGETIGRILEGRHFMNGIHQAIEAKEGVEFSEVSKTVARIDYQHLFRMYKNLGGMSGTCKTDEDELNSIYGLKVVQIPTNKKVLRTDEPFYFYDSTEVKNQDFINRIIQLHNSGRPVLIGTTSVEKSIKIAKMIEDVGLSFNLLNALNDEEESKIISQAGRLGAITIATNMAGRGTDIKLGGNPNEMAKEDMQSLGFSPDMISFADSNVRPETEEQEIARKTFDELQKSHKIVTDAERAKVLEAGGLAVVGTSLNKSQRIDDQLRGRAGRQGEPGSSEIFVAWEDVCEMFEIDDYNQRVYSDMIRRRKIDTSKRIDDQTVLEVIGEIQHCAESKIRQAREQNFKLNNLEDKQREAFYLERGKIIQAFDTFDPSDVKDDTQPSCDLEKFVYALCHRNISMIVDKFMDEKKSNFEVAAQALKNGMMKYQIDTTKLNNERLASLSPKELKQRLSVIALKVFKKSIIETRDAIPNMPQLLKLQIAKQYDTFWEMHLENLEQARIQLSLTSGINQTALFDYSRDTLNSYDAIMSRIQSACINSIYGTLSNVVRRKRAVDKINQSYNKNNKTKQS